ncbi:MAG: hypothetical protein EA373_13360, partial [Oceanospirillales bacterium]
MNRALLEQLRHHTQALHSQLDGHRLLKVLIQNDLSKKEYTESLKALYTPQKSLELNLVAALSIYFPSYQYSLRYPFIEKDLIQLNEQPADNPILELNISNPSMALGILYVLEGSKLGGRYILRCLSDKQLPTAFFQSAINDQTSGWKGFTELTAIKNIEEEQVVSAAKVGF